MKSVLFAAALTLLATPAVPQQPTAIPVDATARAKFRHADGEVIDSLSFINRYVNEHMAGQSDQDHYGVADFWVMAPADGKGDCEDYALTKLFILQRAGFPIVTNTKIVGVLVYRGSSIEGHAILAVRLPSKQVAYLDNMRPELATRKELERAGYRFFDWKA